MKAWYTTGIEGRYPVGACAVCLAEDGQQARRKLAAAVKKEGLKMLPGWRCLPIEDGPGIVVLDGDY